MPFLFSQSLNDLYNYFYPGYTLRVNEELNLPDGSEKSYEFVSRNCNYKLRFSVQHCNPDLHPHLGGWVIPGLNENIDPNIPDECYQDLYRAVGKETGRNDFEKKALTKIMERLQLLGWPELDPDIIGA